MNSIRQQGNVPHQPNESNFKMKKFIEILIMVTLGLILCKSVTYPAFVKGERKHIVIKMQTHRV